MSKYTTDQVADTLIALARQRGINVSNLKLQKLMYYAQAWSLAFYDKPLFDEDFEAWVHGPVVPSIFHRFKTYRWNDITEKVTPLDDIDLISHLKEVLRVYGDLTPNQLERLSHSERPWQNARNGLDPDISSRNRIPQTSMKTFYSGLLKNANKQESRKEKGKS